MSRRSREGGKSGKGDASSGATAVGEEAKRDELVPAMAPAGALARARAEFKTWLMSPENTGDVIDVMQSVLSQQRSQSYGGRRLDQLEVIYELALHYTLDPEAQPVAPGSLLCKLLSQGGWVDAGRYVGHDSLNVQLMNKLLERLACRKEAQMKYAKYKPAELSARLEQHKHWCSLSREGNAENLRLFFSLADFSDVIASTPDLPLSTLERAYPYIAQIFTDWLFNKDNHAVISGVYMTCQDEYMSSRTRARRRAEELMKYQKGIVDELLALVDVVAMVLMCDDWVLQSSVTSMFAYDSLNVCLMNRLLTAFMEGVKKQDVAEVALKSPQLHATLLLESKKTGFDWRIHAKGIVVNCKELLALGASKQRAMDEALAAKVAGERVAATMEATKK